MQEIVYPPGTLLMKEGDAGSHALLIKSGKVEIFRAVLGKKRTIAVIGPGSMVGEMALVDGAPRSACAATTTQTTCIVIDRPYLTTLLNKSPPLVRYIIQSLVAAIRAANGTPVLDTVEAVGTEAVVSRRTPQWLDRRTFRPGVVIFNEGDMAEGAFLIQQGMIEIKKRLPEMGEISLARLGKGRVFGELALLNDSVRKASAVAMEFSVCEVIAKDDFEKLLKTSPPLLRHLVDAYVGIILRQENDGGQAPAA